MCSAHLSGSQNQKKGVRAPKIPKNTAENWGEALSPLHANVCVCDEYSLPLERRYGDTHFFCNVQIYKIHLVVVIGALSTCRFAPLFFNLMCPTRIDLLIHWFKKMHNIISLSASQPYNNSVFDANIDPDGTLWTGKTIFEYFNLISDFNSSWTCFCSIYVSFFFF